jgi:2-polyprenyl-6-methoxyphenol hydroxylase-like FAD-dependent oxidoreductase
VLAADGRNSFVRGALGIETLHVGPQETFAMFEGPYSAPCNAIQLSFDDGLGAAVLPLANGRRWGFELPVESWLAADLAQLRSLVSQRATWQQELPETVTWSTVAHFDRRLARRFGHGHVWLAGDAAHSTSPFGGQSINGGLAEAYELVAHMADCIAGKEALEVLDLVAARREREWQRVLGFAHLDAKPETLGWVLEHARRLVPALPASGQDLHSLLDQLGVAIR